MRRDCLLDNTRAHTQHRVEGRQWRYSLYQQMVLLPAAAMSLGGSHVSEIKIVQRRCAGVVILRIISERCKRRARLESTSIKEHNIRNRRIYYVPFTPGAAALKKHSSEILQAFSVDSCCWLLSFFSHCGRFEYSLLGEVMGQEGMGDSDERYTAAPSPPHTAHKRILSV